MMDSRTDVAKSFVSINAAREEQERSEQERDQLVLFLQLKNDVFEKKSAAQKLQKKSWRTILMMLTSMRPRSTFGQLSTFYAKNMRK